MRDIIGLVNCEILSVALRFEDYFQTEPDQLLCEM